jgi:hypothetical protein
MTSGEGIVQDPPRSEVSGILGVLLRIQEIC